MAPSGSPISHVRVTLTIHQPQLHFDCLLCTAALATEDPSPDLLLETPHGRTEPLINRAMWLHIFVQGFYQIFWLMLIFYGAPAQLQVCAATQLFLCLNVLDCKEHILHVTMAQAASAKLLPRS